MRVSDLIARYLEWHEENNSANTVKSYRQALRWLVAEFGEREWKDLKRDELKEGLRRFNRKTDGTLWEPDTLRRNILALAQLQTFAIDQYDLDPHLRPKDLVKPPGKRRERIPTKEEFEAIIRAADDAFKLALLSLAQSGMRPDELEKARIEDLSLKRDLLVLKKHKTGKVTGRSRRIALGETMQEFVNRAIDERTQGPIWLDANGKPWTAKRLSTRFTQLRNKLGYDKSLVLYSLRHWKGTEVCREFGLLAASLVLGHSKLETTRRYSHLDDADVRKYQEGGRTIAETPSEPKDSSDDQTLREE